MANRRFIDFPIASTVGDNDIILIWQDGLNKQTTKGTILTGISQDLASLTDVDLTGLTNGQILRYNSVTSKWENTDQGNLDLTDLNDVTIVSPSNGQVLVYNSSTSQWENSSGGFVPYVGAVTTVDLGAQGLRAGYVRFDTAIVGVPQEQGVMFWDADDKTVDIILNGYTMKIGEDLFYPVKNQTGSTIAKGVAVRFAGTLGASGRLLIEPFIANGTVPSSRFMGVTAEEILNGDDGKVLYFGRVRGINTDAFNEGDILYASTTVAGGYQTAIPLPPNNIVEVAAVISKSATVGTIFVRPTLGSNINTDEGVKITSVADKNLLQYQSGTALWENKTLAQVLGGTSSQFVKGDGSLDSTSYGTGTVTSVGLSSATSGVTIGSTPVTTSGTITLTIATASGSQNGLLSSTDWTTFNSKQNALTNPITGTGTTNYLPKFTGASTIGNSALQEISGNLGLGVTPSAWSDGKAIEIGNFGNSIWGVGPQIRMSANTYYNSVFRYGTTGEASTSYYQSGGEHVWLNAPSGTAGNAISFTQAMTLNSSGRLLLGTSSDNGARLQVSGTATVDSVSFIGQVPTYGTDFAQFSHISRAGANQYSFLSQNNGATLINAVNSQSIFFRHNNSNLAVITSSGNVGINQNNPSGRLEVVPVNVGGNEGIFVNQLGSHQSTIRFKSAHSSGSDYRIGASILVGSAFEIYSIAAAASRLVITSSGDVGIGTNSPSRDLGGTRSLAISGGGSIAASLDLYGNSRNYAIFTGSAGTLGFFDLTAGVQRLTITSGGPILVNKTTSSAGTWFIQCEGIIASQGTDAGYIYQNRNNSTLYTMYATGGLTYFFNAGNIASINMTTGAYTALSDINKKENFEASQIGLKEVLNLKPTIYSIKNDTKKERHLGFIAQEVKQYIPNAYVESDGFIGLNEMPIIAALTKAIQELKQEIDTLKN